MKMKRIKAIIVAVLLLSGAVLPGRAQISFVTDGVDEQAEYILVSKDTITLAFNIDFAQIPILSNCTYTAEASDSRFNAIVEANGNLTIYGVYNYDQEDRTGTITLTSEDGSYVRTIVVVQSANDAQSSYLGGDDKITVVDGYSDTEETSSESSPFSNSYDGNTSTIFHSNYSSNNVGLPFDMVWYFGAASSVDYMVYVPRQSGTNGNWITYTVYYSTVEGADPDDDDVWTEYGTYSRTGTSSESDTVYFDPTITNVYAVKVTVTSSVNSYVSAAEVSFYTYGSQTTEEAEEGFLEIFANDLYTALNEGVTEEMIVAQLGNDVLRELALGLLDETYDTTYRAASYECTLSISTVADQLGVSGIYYDHLSGVTGISFSPGTYLVVVRDLPDGKTATLNVAVWYDGLNKYYEPQLVSYTLVNGINTIVYDPETSVTLASDYTSEYDGLGYIVYDDDDDPTLYNDIRVHFISGEVNGYLSQDKTNDEMTAILEAAPNKHMDLITKKIHALWTTDGLLSYCYAADQDSKSKSSEMGYLQYMNILDSLATWEHYLLGFYKYDRVPDNRVLLYVNYVYYMYQYTHGVSFIISEESRILNCYTLIYNDNDAIWGMSHELGHFHQYGPYFRWTGMSEVTNNVNSYYNVMKMGYDESDHAESWPAARTAFFTDSYANTYSTIRSLGYQKASTWSGVCDAYYNLALEMQDSLIYSSTSDSLTKAVGCFDVGVLYTLCPMIMLFAYAQTDTCEFEAYNDGDITEIIQDWCEALRQTHLTDDGDTICGSSIEKSDGVDKYELLAAAQNGNKNDGYTQYAEAYPNSCWTTYLSSSSARGTAKNSMPFVLNYIRKVSRLTGYNLFPYFERWGYLRVQAAYVSDYTSGWCILTHDAYDEFKEDMDALVTDGTLKEMDDDMIAAISYTEDWWQDTVPTFPNTVQTSE